MALAARAAIISSRVCYEAGVDPTLLLERLSQNSALTELGSLSVDAWLETPLRDALAPVLTSGLLRAALEGWLSSEAAVPALTRGLEQVLTQLGAERAALKTLAPHELRVTLRELMRRPFSPDRKVVLTIIDREPTRALVRQILLDAVLEFARRASAPMAGVAKGLGALARMAGETVKSRSGGLGSLVGAVGSEVERQVEKRAVEFVDATLASVFGQLADAVADPRRAEEAAELRLALLDGVLELTPAQLSRELINADVPGATELIRTGLRRFLATPEADAVLATAITRVHALLPEQTVKASLEEAGLLDALRPVLVEQAVARLRQVLATPRFAAWLTQLTAE